MTDSDDCNMYLIFIILLCVLCLGGNNMHSGIKIKSTLTYRSNVRNLFVQYVMLHTLKLQTKGHCYGEMV